MFLALDLHSEAHFLIRRYDERDDAIAFHFITSAFTMSVFCIQTVKKDASPLLPELITKVCDSYRVVMSPTTPTPHIAGANIDLEGMVCGLACPVEQAIRV